MSDIVIKGGYGLRNFGDDALMYYLVRSIASRYPELKIALDCTRANYIKKWLPQIKFAAPYELPNVVYIYGGGTLYYSFPKKIAGKSIVDKIFLALKEPSLVVNKLMLRKRYQKFNNANVPKVMFGLGFGPFHQEDQQYFGAIEDVKSTDRVCVRDSVSFDFVTQHSDNTFRGTDICFAKSVVDNSHPNSADKVKKIGVIVRDWNYGTVEDNYAENLVKSVDVLRESGFKVQFIVFSDLRDKDWLIRLSNDGEDILMWNPDIQTIDGFMSDLEAYDLFISARFHGVIFSTLLNKPAISIALEPKLELVKENAVCEVWHPINDSSEELLTLVNNIDEGYRDYVDRCAVLTTEKSAVYESMLDFAIAEYL